MEHTIRELDARALEHDMRTPIANVIALAQLSMHALEDGGAQERILPYLSKILVAAHELQMLTGQIVGGKRAGKETFTALDIAKTLGATLGAQAAQKKQMLRIDVSALGMDAMEGERTALMRILTNLLGNAIKYTQDGGCISLTARRRDAAEVEFAIEDNGIGMKPEFMARMFEPFARAPQAERTQAAGCGLGLSIVRQLTMQMGGSIDVKSEWGKGTAFTLKLPLRTVCRAEDALRGKCFLLAEDNDLCAEIAQALLSGEGASVCRAADGAQAVRLFESQPAGAFDAILMDMRMPQMGGCAAAAAIRANARTDAGRIPILALTADGDAGDEREAIASGMNACLNKPLDIGRLRAAMGICADDHRENGGRVSHAGF
ncbi:MAG: response regulator [Clostridia bacterium]|nr:response regulator [Clostridia bacterium]